MSRLVLVALLLATAVLASSERAFACATLRAQARIDTFGCSCAEGNLESPITVVTGTALIGNGNALPTLGSLVVELQARTGNSIYKPIARHVLSGAGSDFPPPRSVQTCNGPMSAGPIGGRITLVDAAEHALTFDDVKNIPVGVTPLNFIATFAGPMPELKPGSRARVKVYTTAMNSDHPHPCSTDADGDGTVDSNVKTLIFQKTVRVPTTTFLLAP